VQAAEADRFAKATRPLIPRFRPPASSALAPLAALLSESEIRTSRGARRHGSIDRAQHLGV